jgi:hypothetical protein
MIKIDHLITFPDTDGIDHIATFNSNIADVMLALRDEASIRGCLFFTQDNQERTQHTSTYIWEDQATLDAFLEWANTTHQYSAIYEEFTAAIESHGGTIVKTVTEI